MQNSSPAPIIGVKTKNDKISIAIITTSHITVMKKRRMLLKHPPLSSLFSLPMYNSSALSSTMSFPLDIAASLALSTKKICNNSHEK